MKLFDGNWNFDPSVYIVCNRYYKDPMMIMLRREEWAVLNKELREKGEAEWIERIKR